MSFQKLLEDLEAISGSQNDGDEDVTKSMAADGEGAEGGDGEGEGGDADDAAIAAAAEEGEAAGEGDGEGEGDDALGKSMTMTGEDGEEHEVFDATDLLKSLVERQDRNEADVTKALGMVADLVKSQAAQINELSTQVGKLAGAGRGRRAVVSVAERPALAKSLGGEGEGEDQPEGITAKEFMAKAMDACTAGKITGLDVARCESYLNRGLDVPATIKAKVFG